MACRTVEKPFTSPQLPPWFDGAESGDRGASSGLSFALHLSYPDWIPPCIQGWDLHPKINLSLCLAGVMLVFMGLRLRDPLSLNSGLPADSEWVRSCGFDILGVLLCPYLSGKLLCGPPFPVVLESDGHRRGEALKTPQSRAWLGQGGAEHIHVSLWEHRDRKMRTCWGTWMYWQMGWGQQPAAGHTLTQLFPTDSSFCSHIHKPPPAPQEQRAYGWNMPCLSRCSLPQNPKFVKSFGVLAMYF